MIKTAFSNFQNKNRSRFSSSHPRTVRPPFVLEKRGKKKKEGGEENSSTGSSITTNDLYTMIKTKRKRAPIRNLWSAAEAFSFRERTRFENRDTRVMGAHIASPDVDRNEISLRPTDVFE